MQQTKKKSNMCLKLSRMVLSGSMQSLSGIDSMLNQKHRRRLQRHHRTDAKLTAVHPDATTAMTVITTQDAMTGCATMIAQIDEEIPAEAMCHPAQLAIRAVASHQLQPSQHPQQQPHRPRHRTASSRRVAARAVSPPHISQEAIGHRTLKVKRQD